MITLSRKEKMVDVPGEFRQKELRPYPRDNHEPIEEYFYRVYDPSLNKSDRIYLPILWTSYYVNNRHGRDRKALNRLQVFIDSLDKKKKYFGICQYDDGILNKLPFDFKLFGTGCKGDVQLPLVCQPHKYEFKEIGRPIFASFIGQITHPIRQKMVDELKDREGYFISTEQTSLESYCYIMSLSKYALCPRGYGRTSFRIMEALQYGATPVYISDEHLFSKWCNIATEYSFSQIMDESKSICHLINNEQIDANKKAFVQYYTYEAVAKMIYDNL